MALPKVTTPTYELTIPSTGETVTYRPFLVKEEKTLLMAMESKSPTAMSNAMRDIISSCTEGDLDTKDLAPFDLEYFFLQLRGRSIGEVLELKIPRPESVKCEEEDCTEICEVGINIDDIIVDTSKIPDSKLELTDTVGVKMMYPQIDTIQKYSGKAGEDIKPENIFKMINECIEYIWDGDEIFKAKDHTKKELNDFMESLNSKQFNKVRDFFESMPRLSHDIEWKCSKCDKSTTLTLQGIDSFFE